MNKDLDWAQWGLLISVVALFFLLIREYKGKISTKTVSWCPECLKQASQTHWQLQREAIAEARKKKAAIFGGLE